MKATINNTTNSYNNKNYLTQVKIPFTSSKLIAELTKTKLTPLRADTVELSSFLAPQRKVINLDTIRNLNVRNLRILNDRAVSGGTFEHRPIIDLKALKISGVESIIDFRSESGEKLIEACKKEGLRYFRFPLDSVRERTSSRYFVREKGKLVVIKPEFIKDLKEYFEIMNNSNCYVGCHYGIDRTNIGLLLNYFFNPKYNEVPPKIKFWPGEFRKNIINRNVKSIKKIFRSLTPEQKKELNIPDNYEECLREKISRLLRHNYKTTP